jgi:ubiquinone/menaquinone biosynthesis C-methylase UbiE
MDDTGKTVAVGVLTGVISGVTSAVAIDLIHTDLIKRRAFSYAQNLANGKGIINLGAGPHRTFLAQKISQNQIVAANIDIVPNGMPHFMQLDIENERLPFSDRQFDCAFMSHVLEHLGKWDFALGEAMRVADSVVIVLPHPLSPSGWLAPSHKQHFSFDDITEIKRLPRVEVFY